MKRVLRITVGLFFAVVLAGAAYFAWLFWQRLNVPFFTFAQQVTPDGQFANSFLSSGDSSYVSTRTEFSLKLLPPASGYPLIGRTSDDQDVRAILGNNDYVTLSGFMNPHVIFRRESVPAIDLATFPFEEMRYSGSLGGQPVRKSTREARLISEVIDSMQLPVVSLPETDQVYQIELLSAHLPGLAYTINVLVDSSGKVYFARVYDYEHGVEAGPLFMQWIR